MTSQTGFTASSTDTLSWAPYETCWGVGWIGWSGIAIDQLVLPGLPMPPGLRAKPTPDVADLARRLASYFDGRTDWPSGANLIGSAASTAFENEVYRTVTAIPPGETMTYAEVASHVGRPGAARAVGAAMAKNRFAPMIPCHRVVGSDGSLRGYGGGIAMKRHLLEMEAAGA
jgi:methylated-DNA-[protein]-cysteine S-methyltransferase